MRNRNIALAAALLLGLVSVAPQPVSAIDFTSIVNRLTGYRSGYNNANQAQIRSNIDVGVSNLQAQISQGISSGKLMPQEQADLNRELNRIQQMDASFMADGTYSAGEVNQILSEFNNVNNMLSASLSNSSIGTSGFAYGGGGYNPGNFVSLQSRVRANIDLAARNGQISSWQARSMRNELNDLSRQFNNRLNVASRRALMDRLAALDQRVQIAIGGGRYY